MATIKYDVLLLAFDFVSSAAPMEHHAYVSLDTGKIYWMSEITELEQDEIPDDLETSDRYLEVPHKNDLDLGRQLALRFAEERLPHRYDRVEAIFRHRGAYQRFKEILATEGRLEEWYAFETDATEQAIKQWCRDNNIQLAESDREESS
jgi:hypothetical protein